MFTQLKDSLFLLVGATIAITAFSFGWYLGYNVGYGYGYVKGRMVKPNPDNEVEQVQEEDPTGSINPFGSQLESLNLEGV